MLKAASVPRYAQFVCCMCFLHHNKRNLQSVLDSFVTKIKDVSHTVAEGASKVLPRSLAHMAHLPSLPFIFKCDCCSCFVTRQVGNLAVDGAKNVGASAVAMGSKAAEGAKSVGASAVVSFCSFDPLLTRPPWPSKEPSFSAENVHLILYSFPPAQAIGSKGIATAGSKLKQPSPSRELLSSPHLCAFFCPPIT